MDTLLEVPADEFGPEKVLVVREPRLGLLAIVVVDNTDAGTAIGGVRMAPDVDVVEVARLARAMTLKNALAGLPHGGAKAAIVAAPNDPNKQALLRAFAHAIRGVHDYVPGPDMGTDETCMAWLRDEGLHVVGLPAVLGGIPLDDVGATGFGLAVCADALAALGVLKLDGARIVIQGFGAVGRHAARFLSERGARLVGAADSRGGVASPDGLDLDELLALKREGRSVVDCRQGHRVDERQLVGLECDVWIPAARPDVITTAEAADIRASVILEGANIPITPDAEALLARRGVVVVPDFVANAGGVICGAIELHGGSRAAAFEQIEDKIRTNTTKVVETAARTGQPPRTVAEALARARVLAARALRRAF